MRITVRQPAPPDTVFGSEAEITTDRSTFKVGTRVVTNAKIISADVVEGGAAIELVIEIPDDDEIVKVIRGE